jgi:FkbM family methyltransferase
LSYKKALIGLLDRPGGRFLLGKIATRVMGGNQVRDVEIAYIDGLWTRRVGRHFFPDGRRFEYAYSDFGAWKGQMERYEADTREYWLQHYRPREGDVVVDVGAGRGEDTFTFSQGVGPSGRVFAIEAHPVSFVVLKNFCRLNQLSNVTALHVALMDRPGTVTIAESESNWQENAVNHDSEVPGISVSAATLDELCEKYGIKNIAFLKMNIEGAERYALGGAQAVMPRIRQICVACHDFRADMGHGEQFRTRAFVSRLLREHGFTLTSRPDDPRDYVRDHIFGLLPGSSAVPVNDSISRNASSAAHSGGLRRTSY